MPKGVIRYQKIAPILNKGKAQKIQYARSLIDLQPAILSTQVISEVCTELLKKGRNSEGDVERFIEDVYTNHRFVDGQERISHGIGPATSIRFPSATA